MNSGNKKIFVWLITWAGLLVLVLYSPIGSPDLYESNKYDVEFRGVDFGGYIQNAPTMKSGGSKNNTNFNMPSYADVQPNKPTYNVTPRSSAVGGTGGGYSVAPLGNNTNSKNNPSGGNAGMEASGVMSSNNTSQGGTNSFSSPPGMLSLSTNLAPFGESNPRFGNPYGTHDGATDPGEDEVFGPPIPVGDGWIFLLLLALTYAGWKRFFKTL